MNLQLAGKRFAVGGATSGLGEAIALALLEEGATVIGIARTEAKLNEMANRVGERFLPYAADLSDATAIDELGRYLVDQQLYGCAFNTGGPPTGLVEELSMADWDEAYASTLRWKVQLSSALLPGMRSRGEGRLLFVESVSIKQPIDNLVLSNAMRSAVAGFVKTMSREVGADGITANILAPGYHATPRITKVLEKSAELRGEAVAAIERQFTAETAVRRLGAPAEFAALAILLLSPGGGYITGQTISVDGGLVRHLTG